MALALSQLGHSVDLAHPKSDAELSARSRASAITPRRMGTHGRHGHHRTGPPREGHAESDLFDQAEARARQKKQDDWYEQWAFDGTFSRIVRIGLLIFSDITLCTFCHE